MASIRFTLLPRFTTTPSTMVCEAQFRFRSYRQEDKDASVACKTALVSVRNAQSFHIENWNAADGGHSTSIFLHFHLSAFRMSGRTSSRPKVDRMAFVWHLYPAHLRISAYLYSPLHLPSFVAVKCFRIVAVGAFAAALFTSNSSRMPICLSLYQLFDSKAEAREHHKSGYSWDIDSTFFRSSFTKHMRHEFRPNSRITLLGFWVYGSD